MITAEQVRDAMRERGLSEGKLSELAKVSKPVISTWLNGVREPSDISKTRIAFALDLLEPGDADDKQVSAAIAPDPEPEEIPALDPPETDETDDAPAARPSRDDDTDYLTDEDIAAQEIMDALGMRDPAPEPEPDPEPEPIAEDINVPDTVLEGFEPFDLRQHKRQATKPTRDPEPEPDPQPEPAPTPTIELRADSAAELLYRLTRVPGVHLYEDNDRCLNIAIPRGSDLEQFAENLDTLDTMLATDAISAEAHDAAVKSLLERAARKEAEA